MNKAVWRIAVLAAVALASACSAPGSAPAPLPVLDASSVSQSFAPSGFGSWLYTCSASTGTCATYTVSGTALTYKKTLTPPGRPLGGFATATGTWYEALVSASDAVTYKSTTGGPSGPTSTLADTGAAPIDVAVNTAKKLVVVSNEFGANHGPANVEVYLNGAKTPTRTLNFVPKGGQGVGFGVATDSRGNCYWMVDDTKNFNADVVEFVGCTGNAKLLVTTPKFGAAGGVAVDGSNNLYYVDQSNGVYKCTGTKSCVQLAGGFSTPVFIRFDAGWKNLWLTDTGSGQIFALNPSTGAIESTTPENGGAAPGLALAPGPAH